MSGIERATAPIRIAAVVWEALEAGRPVVGLESSVFAQGLPIPANRDALTRMTGAVAAHGGTPAITGIVQGVPALGLTPEELERFLARDGVAKVSARDLAATMASGGDGATTVAGTLAILRHTAVSVFATGGIGGVHRGDPFDESADLQELARAGAVVVCAGAKSILDLPATVERLETLGVPVVGYQTSEFPAFFCRTSGLPISVRVEHVAEIAAIVRAHRALGRTESVLVVQPPPLHAALPSDVVEAAIKTALADAARCGIRGPSTTPFLLAAVERATGGQSLPANLALLESNATLAVKIAECLTS